MQINNKLINQKEIFGLTNTQTISISDIGHTGTASNITVSDLAVNYNDSLTTASFIGNISIGKTGTTPGNITFNTNLRPSSEITVRGNVLRIISAGTTVENVLSHSMTISTSGVITISYTFVSTGNDSCRFAFLGFPIIIE